MSNAKVVARGQVWIANLDPGFGVEIRKIRPVVIISNNVINKNWPRIITLPFSSLVHPLIPGKVLIEKGEVGVERDSVILAFDIRSIDKSRLIKKIGKIGKEKLFEVEEAIKLVLGMIELD